MDVVVLVGLDVGLDVAVGVDVNVDVHVVDVHVVVVVGDICMDVDDVFGCEVAVDADVDVDVLGYSCCLCSFWRGC